MKGVIFDIQTYAVYDGPGIRTLVFFKGCPLRCAWCHNPESWNRNPEMAYLGSKCIACGKCVEVCPEKALSLNSDKQVVRDDDLCVVCGKCAKQCEAGAMEKIGWLATPEEIAQKVLADKPFYDNSEGGATITGGESTLQPEFLLAVIDAIRAGGVHVALETCGWFGEDLLEKLLPRVDLFLYDLKCIDSAHHKEFTGVNPERILANFETILSRAGSKKILPRIPLIPGFNVDEASISDLIGFLQQTGYQGPVHLMPYNRLAKTKWEKLGRLGQYRNLGELAEEKLGEIAARFEAAGFEVVVNE